MGDSRGRARFMEDRVRIGHRCGGLFTGRDNRWVFKALTRFYVPCFASSFAVQREKLNETHGFILGAWANRRRDVRPLQLYDVFYGCGRKASVPASPVVLRGAAADRACDLVLLENLPIRKEAEDHLAKDLYGLSADRRGPESCRVLLLLHQTAGPLMAHLILL